MALEKSKTLPSGVAGNYWKVDRILMSPTRNMVFCQLSLYLDKAHGQNEAQSLTYCKSYNFGVSREEKMGNLMSLCYSKIKEEMVGDPDLQDAVDV